MIAVDTSSWIAYLQDDSRADVLLVDQALTDRQVCLPPVVLAELLSDPKLSSQVISLLRALPLLAVTDGYWGRAGFLRAKLLAAKRKAPLADTLITQSCLDHDVRLIARDSGYRHFSRIAGLKLFG